jgi:hypothetical protein
VSLAHPVWVIAWDFDQKLGPRTRIQELRKLAKTHELVFAPHFPFPGIGRIEITTRGFSFRSDLLANK